MKIKQKTQLLRQIHKLNRNIEELIKAHYQLIDMILPEKNPTKWEREIIKKRKNEKVIPFKSLKEKLKRRLS